MTSGAEFGEAVADEVDPLVDDRRFAVTRRLHTAPCGCVVMTFAAAEIGGQP